MLLSKRQIVSNSTVNSILLFYIVFKPLKKIQALHLGNHYSLLQRFVLKLTYILNFFLTISINCAVVLPVREIAPVAIFARKSGTPTEAILFSKK